MQVKWSVTLADRLGSGRAKILIVLEIKGQVLYRVLLHVSVPDWLSDSTALLTSTFLSRLNEMRGDRENMCLVSGSLQTFLKFLRMTILIACRPGFCGWWVRVNGILLVS